jgi:ribosomal protein S18 acetylase RimI-like enzyme
MELQIRELGPLDATSLLALFSAVLPRYVVGFASTESPVSAAEGFLCDEASFVFGAYVDGEPAGLAWGIQMRYPTGRLVTYLHELDVREEFRRHGIGTALVKQSMDAAKRKGSTRFWLSTGGHNDVAQSLYESLGGVRKPLGDVNYWWEFDEQPPPARATA